MGGKIIFLHRKNLNPWNYGKTFEEITYHDFIDGKFNTDTVNEADLITYCDGKQTKLLKNKHGNLL
jgi:hypothetical protein